MSFGNFVYYMTLMTICSSFCFAPSGFNPPASSPDSGLDQIQRHKLEALRTASADLLATLTSQASGRQALLNTFGSGALLNAIAVSLSDALQLPCTIPSSPSTSASMSEAEMRRRLSS
ncbi:unnamed protein product, partial [Echinostoma caproni]